MFELNFYQDGDKWKHKLIPIQISKNKSDRVIDLVQIKTEYALFEELNVFLGNQIETFIFRQCLNSYTNENALMSHKENC